MTLGLLLAGLVILLCVLLNRFTQKFGIPMLLVFIFLGLLFGSDGLLKIPFEDYALAEAVCSTALIFILFYGGFGTNWKQARPVAVKSALLATFSVAATALLTALACRLLLRIPLPESLLIGSVLSSTDAASVFSILRSKKLGLKHNTDSMLELESGSNDPCSYLLTVVMISVMEGNGAASLPALLFSQFFFGVLIGVGIGLAAAFVLRRFRFATGGFDMAFVTGIALLSYAAAAVLGGNGYLSAYLCGILLGNRNIPNQKPLVHFFDGVTGLMQMLLFFLLGLLATPSRIPQIFLPALVIMLALTFVARPLSIFAVLTPFRCTLRQQTLVSFAGLRGAASIVFAVMATVKLPDLAYDLYHIVFCIVLLSISFQGSLLPLCAKWLDMTDAGIDVLKTFSDYSDQAELQFIRFQIEKDHAWAGQALQAITLPPGTLIVMLLRQGRQLIPNGKTLLREGDIAVLAAYQFQGESDLSLLEYEISPGSEWIGKTIQQFSPRPGELIILIIRGSKTLLPKGQTRLREKDILLIHSDVTPPRP